MTGYETTSDRPWRRALFGQCEELACGGQVQIQMTDLHFYHLKLWQEQGRGTQVSSCVPPSPETV